MTDITVKGAVRAQTLWWGAADRARTMGRDERGEMGSWMILAAGLAVAAGIAVTALSTWFQQKTTAITSN